MRPLLGNDLNLGTAVGTDANLIFPRSLRSTHLYVCGATGTGKSKFLENLIRQDIKNWHKSKCGLLVLDPHGSLYDNLMDWLAWNENLLKVPVVPVDLRQDEWVLAYNVLRERPAADPAVVINNFVQAMAYVWGETGTDRTPLFARWASNILRTLYEAKLTLVEARYLIDQSKKKLRASIIKGVRNPSTLRDWALADTLSAIQFESTVGSTVNRLHRFLETKLLASMFGQTCASFDLATAIEEGQIVLVSLATRHNRVSEEDAALFATLLLSDLWTSAKDRDKGDNLKPFYCYIDEFQNFVTPTIAKNLDQARGFGLHLTLAHQFPLQLMHTGSHGKEVYDSILVNARSKVVFSLSGEENLRPLAQELFMGTINPMKIKHELYTSKVLDYAEETRTVYGKSSSSGTGSTVNAGSSAGSNLGGSEIYLDPRNQTTDPVSGSQSSGSYRGSSANQADSELSSEGESESEIPFLKPIVGTELSSVQFESIEEQVFRSMAALNDQEQRQCVARLAGMKAPLSLYTPVVQKTPASKAFAEKYFKNCILKLPFVLSGSDAQKHLSDRQRKLESTKVDDEMDAPPSFKRKVK